ncbi:MAG: hypothetical protein AAF434_14080 [Pseudomonadota bacterium]
MATDTDPVMFDILLKSAGSGRVPNLGNLDDFKPPQEAIDACSRWFSGSPLVVSRTPFGFSGSASQDQIEALFSARLERVETPTGQTAYRVIVAPSPPRELAEFIDQITVIEPPVHFEA